MSLLRQRVRHLIHQLSQEVERISDEDLEHVSTVVQPLYYDLYIFRAIREAQGTVRPGDSLTREEAIQFLNLQ